MGPIFNEKIAEKWNLWVRKQCTYALFTDPQITLFSNFFIKNRSHGTIHTFKNYFATVFSVFSFQFQQNKFYPNTLFIYRQNFCILFFLMSSTFGNLESTTEWSEVVFNIIVLTSGLLLVTMLIGNIKVM